MALATGIDWDRWRAEHANMSFADQQMFYGLVAQEHPCQQHFDRDAAGIAFGQIRGTYRVIELGGWDGALASWLIDRFPISAWTNYDIADVPQVCTHPGYERVVLDEYFWNRRHRADVFVATHTIEHLTGAELSLLLDSLDVRFVYLEAPLAAEGQDWSGYVGSHILELGWLDVGELLLERGYSLVVAGRESGLWAR